MAAAGLRLHFVLTLLKSIWLALWLLASSTALAQDHITERSWLEDPSGQLIWSDVQQQPTQPYTGLLSKGFGAGVIWLRLRLVPPADLAAGHTADQLVLRIRPVYLDDIQVFDPLAPQGLAGVTGDLRHPRLDKYQGLDFLLPIPSGLQPRDIWLRLETTSTRQIDVQALTPDELNERTLRESLAFAIYIGLVAVLAIWGIAHWLFSLESLIGIFGLKELTAMLFALASMGHLRAVWPADWPATAVHHATSVFSVSATSAAVLFHIQLIREFEPPLWLRRLHVAMFSLLPVKLILLLVWPIAALSLNMSEVLLYPWVFLVSVLLCKAWSPSAPKRTIMSRPVVIGFYALFLVLLVFAGLTGLGIIGGSEIGLYIVQVHGLVTALLVLVMLLYRNRVMQKQQQQTTLALERSQLLALHESQLREEQEKLLAMLAHELKTPLATMHMRLDAKADGNREIKQAIRDMNGVIERCQQTLRLSDHQLEPHTETVDMMDMVKDAISTSAQTQRIQLTGPAQLLLHTDRQLCSIVLNNLLENACKYAAPDSLIELRLSTDSMASSAPNMRLEIVNQPNKANWPDPEKMFIKYYRSPHARRQAGTGLGLYLVNNLMKVMGGSVEYAPTDTQIRFVLTWPLMGPQSAAQERALQRITTTPKLGP